MTLPRVARYAAPGSAAAHRTAAPATIEASTTDVGSSVHRGTRVKAVDCYSVRTLAAVAAIAASLLMTELALTRIFSVVMYYHFAFLAISIALFGLSASGVYAYLRRRTLDVRPTEVLLARQSLIFAASTIVSLFALVRLRVGLNYSPSNLALMLAIYGLAALPFFTGGAVISFAFTRLTDRINVIYAADLLGASVGCLALIPLLNQLGAPGVVMIAATLSLVAALCFGS